MTKFSHRIILVIGNNHKEIAEKYSGKFYKWEHCQQHRLEVTGEEGDFSDPFHLKDGTKSYSAHYDEIDWDKIHRNKGKLKLNERVWELVVNDETPINEFETDVKKRMKERLPYFTDNFKSKEEFVNHSSSLWYWGIATQEKYDGLVEEKIDDNEYVMDWCVNFFEKYIKPLKKTNPLITIYETHSL